MSFASESGYTPLTVAELMDLVRTGVNTQFGTSYTAETFVGTNFYKYFYALIQRLQENEVKTSEIFTKLQGYFALTNERISRPVVTNPGLIEALKTLGYVAALKKPIDADAGKAYIAVDVLNTLPDYAARKLAINSLIKNSVAAGIVTQGTEVSTITLTNGQAFDFKFKLPNRIVTKLRLTVTVSANNQSVVLSPDAVKAILIANIKARYSLGKNFEPQKYFSTSDAPYAQSVKLEYSTDGGTTYSTATYVANYDDLFVITLANIDLIEA